MLPSDILEIIFRFIIKQQYSISLILENQSPFNTIAPRLLPSLILKNTNRPKPRNPNAVHVDCAHPDSVRLLEASLGHFGTEFESILIYSNGSSRHGVIPLQALALQCTGVRKLEISSDGALKNTENIFTTLIVAYGSTLKELGLRYSAGLRADPNEGEVLSRFAYITVANCVSLEKLNLRVQDLYPLNSLWPSVGLTLKCLNLNCPSGEDWTPTLNLIQQHCRSLQFINLACADHRGFQSETAFTSLLTSYGAQLKEANLGVRSYTSALAISSACPNLRCSLRTSGDNLERMKLLDVKSLNFSDDEVTPDSVLTACELKNLESLQIYLFDAEHHFRTFFKYPKTNLLSLQVTSRLFLSADTFHDAAGRSGSLRFFKLNVGDVTGDALSELAQNNPLLEVCDVCLCADKAESVLISLVETMVKSLLPCRKLTSVKIQNLWKLNMPRIRKLADAVVFLRRLQVRVQLLGHDYT